MNKIFSFLLSLFLFSSVACKERSGQNDSAVKELGTNDENFGYVLKNGKIDGDPQFYLFADYCTKHDGYDKGRCISLGYIEKSLIEMHLFGKPEDGFLDSAEHRALTRRIILRAKLAG